VSAGTERAPYSPAPAAWGSERVAKPAILAALVLLVAWYLFNLDRDLLARYGPNLLRGLGVTLQLVAISIAFGALLAVPVAFARLSPGLVAGGAAYAYVYLFRGTPLLAQTFLFYYGAGQFRPQLEAVGLWTVLREPYWCALIIFTLNTAAYQAEIYKGAIAAVPRGQWEAGRALGLRGFTLFSRVIAPQALTTALRPLGNEIIFMIKGSAIASVITILDLMGETRRAFSRTLDFELYFWAAALYLLLVELLRRVFDRLERRLTRHLQRDAGARPGAAPQTH